MELTKVQGVGWIRELRGHHQSAPLSEPARAGFCSSDSPARTHSAPAENKHPVSLITHLNPALEDFLLGTSYSSATPPVSLGSQEGMEA